jgi:hypothetical protein
MSEMLEDFATLRLAHGSVLDHLEASGIVEVRRDSWGEIVHVTMRADPSTFAASLLELGRREFSPPAAAPLSNQRLKLRRSALGRVPLVRQRTAVLRQLCRPARPLGRGRLTLVR